MLSELPSKVYCRYGDSVDGLRNRWRQFSRVNGMCVPLGVIVWMVLSVVSKRYLSRGIRGDRALMRR